MLTRCLCSALALSIPLLAGVPAHAQSTASGPEACAAISAPADRLACYDARFPPVDSSPALTTAEQAAKAEKEFGLSAVELRERARDAGEYVRPDRLEAVVTELDFLPGGERVVTLDNGQVWLLTEVTSKGHLKAGSPVSIKRAALGSFLLVTPSRIPLRTRRLR